MAESDGSGDVSAARPSRTPDGGMPMNAKGEAAGALCMLLNGLVMIVQVPLWYGLVDARSTAFTADWILICYPVIVVCVVILFREGRVVDAVLNGVLGAAVSSQAGIRGIVDLVLVASGQSVSSAVSAGGIIVDGMGYLFAGLVFVFLCILLLRAGARLQTICLSIGAAGLLGIAAFDLTGLYPALVVGIVCLPVLALYLLISGLKRVLDTAMGRGGAASPAAAAGGETAVLLAARGHERAAGADASEGEEPSRTAESGHARAAGADALCGLLNGLGMVVQIPFWFGLVGAQSIIYVTDWVLVAYPLVIVCVIISFREGEYVSAIFNGVMGTAMSSQVAIKGILVLVVLASGGAVPESVVAGGALIDAMGTLFAGTMVIFISLVMRRLGNRPAFFCMGLGGIGLLGFALSSISGIAPAAFLGLAFLPVLAFYVIFTALRTLGGLGVQETAAA